ncbi:hypothetical protein [Ralstonia phage RP13]|nr:hypothetical protein [Ralstonia phage RP13]
MEKTLEGDYKIVFVGHSLGGVYAAWLYTKMKDRVVGAISLATPYGGSEAAMWLNTIKPAQIYKDIVPYSQAIRGLTKHEFPEWWTIVVTTRGHSHLMYMQNDGVVTHESMTTLKGGSVVEVPYNHHEVLCADEVVDIINSAVLKHTGVAHG